MARKALVALVLAGALVSMGALSACNTVSGAGRDIERGGEKIQDASKDVQRKM
jgi:predicted small secreted protein